MLNQGRGSRFLAVCMVLFFIVLQIAAIGTATFAENRETSKNTQGITEPQTEEDDKRLQQLAEKYQVELEYLKYIVDIEKLLRLSQFELLALIAQESGFKPKTHMDGGSYSYSTTQMKLPTAKTAQIALREYYQIEVPEPTHELMAGDQYYATLLAGGYLRYLHDVYKNEYESLTAYRWGINGRLEFFRKNGHYESPYAKSVIRLRETFATL